MKITILEKYYFKLIIPYYLGSVALFVMLFVLGQVRAVIDSLRTGSISFFIILHLISLTIPTQLFVSLPVSLNLANALVFGIMTQNNEILAIKSFGIRVEVFLRAVIFFAILVLLITYLNTDFLMPYASSLYKKILYKYRAATIESALIENKIESFMDFKIYVEKSQYLGKLRIYQDIVIVRNYPTYNETIYAKKGYIDDALKKEGIVIFTMLDGTYINSSEDRKMVSNKFAVMQVYFTVPQQSIAKGLLETPLIDLYKMIKKIQAMKDEQKNVLIMYEDKLHFKLSFILSSLFFAFSGFAIVKGFNNLNLGRALFISFILIMLFYTIFMFATRYFLMRTTVPTTVIYYSTLLVFFIIGGLIYIGGYKK